MTATHVKDAPAQAATVREERQRQALLSTMQGRLEEQLALRLRSLRVTLPEQSAPVKDPEEAGVEDFARDMEVALAEIGSWMLRRIQEARQRIAEGTYGECVACGAHIAEARLRALPFAELCIACQRRREAEVNRGRA